MASKTTFTHDSTTSNLANSKGWTLKFTHVPSTNEVWFKALITDYNESFESQWNEESVFGRMDPISTFVGTTRKISLAWDVVASSLEEAKENLYRASLLAQFLYPTYENRSTTTYSHGTMTAAPLIKVQFANIIANASGAYDFLLCTLSGLQITPDLEAGWMDPGGELYPKLIRMSTQLTVMHTHKLGFDHDMNKWRGLSTDSGDSFPWKGMDGMSPSFTPPTTEDCIETITATGDLVSAVGEDVISEAGEVVEAAIETLISIGQGLTNSGDNQ